MASTMHPPALLDPQGNNHIALSGLTKDRLLKLISISVHLEHVAIELAYLPMSKAARVDIGVNLMDLSKAMLTLLNPNPVPWDEINQRIAAAGVTDDVLNYAVTH